MPPLSRGTPPSASGLTLLQAIAAIIGVAVAALGVGVMVGIAVGQGRVDGPLFFPTPTPVAQVVVTVEVTKIVTQPVTVVVTAAPVPPSATPSVTTPSSAEVATPVASGSATSVPPTATSIPTQPPTATSVPPTPVPPTPGISIASSAFLQDLPVSQGDTPEKGFVTIQGQRFLNSIRYLLRGQGSAASEYALNGRYKTFQASLGVDPNANVPVRFEIFLDGKRIDDRMVSSSEKAPIAVSYDVRGYKVLRLQVSTTTMFCCETAFWGDAALIGVGPPVTATP